jgi:uncharacterized tellurite resistance protein B-like protein
MAKEKDFFSFLDRFTVVEDDSSSYEVGISDDGFSYLDMLSEKKAKQITFEDRQNKQTSAALDGSTGARGKSNIAKVETVNHDSLCFDTDLNKIIKDLQARRNRMRLLPLAASIAFVLFLAWLLLPTLLKVITGLIGAPVILLVLFNVWRWDAARKHVRFKYRITGAGQTAFNAINSALGKLASSEQVLYYTGRRHFEDTRYSGGATSLPTFAGIILDHRAPPLLDLDIKVWHIRIHGKDLYFMPDHLLVYDGARIGGISYGRIEISSLFQECQARDIARRTRDCEVVGNTWRFTNKDGSPDKRFNNNSEVPILKYGVLKLAGPNLDMQFFTTLQAASTNAPRGFAPMQNLAKKPQRNVAEARRGQTTDRRRAAAAPKSVNAPRSVPVDIYSVFMDAMCCVMAADKRATTSEQKRIHSLMQELGSGWSQEQINNYLKGFLDKVRKGQRQAILEDALGKAKAINKLGKGQQLLKCVQSLAEADGSLDPKEKQICDRFVEALS